MVYLIGCSTLQHSKTPWNYVDKTIKVLNDDEETRSHFIKDFETLYQKHKYDSEEFRLKLADVMVDHATVISAKLRTATSSE